jgi:uncharacterized membrane-anchored protein
LVAVAAALVYPVKKILDFEFPPVPPREYLFKCNIVDPYDPMRGRYVILGFGNQIVKTNQKLKAYSRYGNYLVLEKNENGETKYVDVINDRSQRPPNKDILRLKSCFYNEFEWKNGKRTPGGHFIIGLPFDRYYLNEKLAPAAETLVRSATRRGEAYVKVNIYNDGNFAIADLIVDGKPIMTLLR